MLKKILTALCVCLLICFAALGAEAAGVLKEKEPNEVMEDAVPMKSSLYEGKIGGEDILDLYSFKTKEGMTAAVALASDSKTAFVALYDQYGTYVAESSPFGTIEGAYTEALVYTVAGGKYYAAVWDESESVHSYAISVEVACTEHELLEVPVILKEPTLTEDGEQMRHCERCGEEVIEPVPCIQIKRLPKDAYTQMGVKSKVSVLAKGSSLKYRWYVKNAGEDKYKKSTVQISQYFFTMDEKIKDRMVYCVIKDKFGNEYKTEPVRLYAAATVTEQPKDAKALVGSNAKTTVTAVGDGLTYTWYIKNPGDKKFSKSSTKTATYAVKMTEARSGRQAYCVVKDKYGQSVTTDTVTLSAAKPVAIKTQPKTTYTKNGATAKVTVKAAGDGLKYTWYIKNKGASKYTKSSITKSSYSIKMSSKTKDRQLYCVVTDKYGNTVKTKTVVMRMAASITTQPKTVTVAKNKTAKVTVKAAGDGLKYTWYFKDSGKKSFSKSSVKTASYSTTMTAARSGRQVYCVVKDKYGKTVKSSTATLKMK